MILAENYFNKLKISKDSVVADFGCGVSETTFKLYKKFSGSISKVYLVDIKKEIVEKQREKIASEKLENFFESVWGSVDELGGSRLKDKSVDIIIFENTYHFLKNKKTALLEIKRILKAGGKLLFIDYHTAIGKSTFHQSLLTPKYNVERVFEEAGFLVYPIEEKSGKYMYAFIAENRQKEKEGIIKIKNN